MIPLRWLIGPASRLKCCFETLEGGIFTDFWESRLVHRIRRSYGYRRRDSWRKLELRRLNENGHWGGMYIRLAKIESWGTLNRY